MAAVARPVPGRRPRGPGYTFLALTLVLAALVAVVSLTFRQTPPPTIAEFAPQAIEQITDSPDDQTSSRSERAGEDPAATDAGLGAVPPAAPALDAPRVRRCVGDPPRQIEYPQSPPCVPYWDGDNGGATYKGVTRDEIRVVVPSDTG